MDANGRELNRRGPLGLRATLLSQGLIEFPLVEESFFRLKGPGVDDADLFAVRAIDAEDAGAGAGHAQVKKAGLGSEAWRVGQEPNRKRILEGFFDFLQIQRAIEIERGVIPIKLHSSSIVNVSPMQCRYNVFTHGRWGCQQEKEGIRQKGGGRKWGLGRKGGRHAAEKRVCEAGRSRDSEPGFRIERQRMKAKNGADGRADGWRHTAEQGVDAPAEAGTPNPDSG